jgi:hypothetical protein
MIGMAAAIGSSRKPIRPRVVTRLSNVWLPPTSSRGTGQTSHPRIFVPNRVWAASASSSSTMVVATAIA